MERDHSAASVEPRVTGRRAAWFDALAAAVALVGLFDAIYLTTKHLAGGAVRCTLVAGCDEVLQSDYSSIGGFPLAALGALAYFAVFSRAILSAFGYTRLRVFLTTLVALMFAASLWLLYLQAFVIRAFCQYCLLSAAVTTLLLIIVITGRLFRFK
jgi:uncharacterized membrane protein